MVIGNGVDIVEIERISEIVKKNPRFLERCFTENERALFLEKGMKIETIAAGFAGKEAVSKALGTGIRGFNFVDIEILRDALGKPVVQLLGKARDVAINRQIYRIELSLSHSDHQAIAFAISLSE